MVELAKPPSKGIAVGTPSYQVVVAYIRARIAAGEWPPGHQLPTIVQLAELTGTTQTAVKTGLLLLREAGVVRGQQGKGTFVAEEPAS